MADEARLNSLVTALNKALGEITPYKLAVVDPADVQPVDKNAHYMPKRVYDQLTANVQRDGNLSSLPFCWRKPDGGFVSLSGNHRVQVARDAEVPMILILYSDDQLSRSQQLAIQLSHNALVGGDNPQTLRELWQEIDRLDMKVYSGLDDEYLETVAPVQVMQLGEAALRMEELTMWFVPSETEHLQAVMKQLGKGARLKFLAQVEAFDRFFQALLDFKEAANIVSTATAILVLTEVAERWVAEHNEAEQDDGDIKETC